MTDPFNEASGTPARDRGGSQPPPAVVIGAGAAGLLAAIFAARGGARVRLLESRPKPGAKIRISGGGRCNILPSEARLDDFHTSGSMHTLRNVLFSWPLADVRTFFERELGIALKTEPTGKVFPRSDSSKEVVDALLSECARAGVVLDAGRRVDRVRRADADGARFAIDLAGGETIAASRVVIATGGLSLPKTGSDGAGYRFARELGHSVGATSPALVPLHTSDVMWSTLAGVACPVCATVRRGGEIVERRTGDLLITHEGWSGPVVLDVSRWFTTSRAPGEDRPRLEVGWGALDAESWDELLRAGGGASVGLAVRARLPRRLADFLVERAGVDPESKLATLPRALRVRAAQVLGACTVGVAGDAGYAKAEVTAGGVPLEEVERTTMESRIVPGLHFAGEILDATGRIGGYNFLWAWVTGRIAGLALAAGDE
jgi:predicted Rossmann fold flavoprotein